VGLYRRAVVQQKRRSDFMTIFAGVLSLNVVWYASSKFKEGSSRM